MLFLIGFLSLFFACILLKTNPDIIMIKLTEALERFKVYCYAERFLKPVSVSSYDEVISAFITYLDGLGYRRVNHVTAQHIVQFTSPTHSMNKGHSIRTLARKRSIIRAFFRFCVYDGKLTVNDNPAMKVENFKTIYPKYPNIISVEEVCKMIDNARDADTSVLFELLYATGIRVSELVNMEKDDVYLSQLHVRVRSGKGDRERLVPIHKLCAKKLDQYMTRREQITPYSPAQKALLFLQSNGKHYTRQRIYQMIVAAAKTCGIEKKVTPHTFRHSFATHMYDGGASLIEIKDMLGHDSIYSTEIYVHVSNQHLRKVLENYHPRF